MAIGERPGREMGADAEGGGPPPRRPHRPALAAAGILALGLTSLVLYVFALVQPYPLTRYVAQPLLDLGKIGGYSPLAGRRFAATLAALWLAYLVAGLLAPRAGRSLRPLTWGGTTLFAVALLWLYPITAADIFNYLLYGLAQGRGANPLVTPPAETIGPPLIGYSAWPAHPSPYGPAWQWVARGVTALTGERLLAGVLGFKLVLAACHLLNVALIERLAADAAARPPAAAAGLPPAAAAGFGAAGRVAARPGVAALLYGWNPFILYETVGNGHNDIVMLTALLAALWAFTRPEPDRSLALPFVALGALTKFVAALWAPPLAWGLWVARAPGGRRGFRPGPAILAGGCCVLLAALLYRPFWAGDRTFAGLRQQSDLYTTSFGGLAAIVLAERRQLFTPQEVLKGAKALALAALGLTFLLRRPRVGTLPAVLASLFDLTLVYLLVGALWFQPWYLVPLLGLAPLVDRARQALAVVFALGATGSYLVYFYLWPALDWTPDRLLIQSWAVAVAHGPVLLALAVLAAWPGARRTG